MVTVLRQVFEVYGAVFSSGWFWLLYTFAGVRVVWTEWDEFREDIAKLGLPPALAAFGLILLWAEWPYVAFMQGVRRTVRRLEKRGWGSRDRSTRH
jgi:hypothetical protein